ncbi:MAG: glycosyltransferase family 4 protein [Chloroflexota bacterium]
MNSMSTMHVLIFSWQYPPYMVGGMGKHVAELAPALNNVDLDGEPIYVDVITTRYGGGPAEEQVNDFLKVYRVDTPPIAPIDYYNSAVASNYSLIAQARKLAWQKRYDLIHNHDWLTGTASVTLKHEWKTPLLTTIHATERGRHQGHLPSETSKQIDRIEGHTCYEAWRVIACSDFMRQEIQSYFGVPSDKVDIIANGIDSRSQYKASPELIQRLRKKFSPNRERLLYFVGRITPEKGLHVLIQAMPQILEKYPDVRLLAGGKNSEKYLPLAHELGVAHAVNFLGYLTDEERDHLYQVVDCAIIPSLYEPFGIVALEAMALGCNIITTDVGGLGEVVNHTENGLTVYPNDAASIAWAVDQLFNDPDSARKRRRTALQEVKERYNWGVIAQETAYLYAEIIRERATVDW